MNDLGFDLAPGEKVDQVFHRSWYAVLPAVLAGLGILLCVLIVTYLYGRYGDATPGRVKGSGLLILNCALIVLGALIVYIGFWVNRRNYLVLTNQHLVRVDQRGLLNRSVAQLSLDRVQDVSGGSSGFMATIFGFGNITVETAGAEDNFIFPMVASPGQVAASCLKAHEAFMQASPAAAGATPAPPASPKASMSTAAAPPPGMVEEVIYVPEVEAKSPSPTPQAAPAAAGPTTVSAPASESTPEPLPSVATENEPTLEEVERRPVTLGESETATIPHDEDRSNQV